MKRVSFYRDGFMDLHEPLLPKSVPAATELKAQDYGTLCVVPAVVARRPPAVLHNAGPIVARCSACLHGLR